MTALPAATRWMPIASAVAFLFAAAPALADCQEDMGKLMGERQAMINSLNKMKSGAKAQLDPIAACPKLRTLAGIEGKVVSYLEKNKDWCNVPDGFLDNAKVGHQKSIGFAAQACKVAAQVQKMRQQQAQGGPMGAPQVQKLPSGPL